MNRSMTRHDIGKRAGEYFQSGFHCAEAVASAVLEARGMDTAQARKHATAFGGGMGRTFCETCGAISGGLIAIGHLHGRSEQGVNWDLPAEMGRDLRDRFISEYGETCCQTLRDRFGDEQGPLCTRLVEHVAAATEAVLTVKRLGRD